MDTIQQTLNCDEELGEIICPECKGQTATEQGMYWLRCPKCQGTGKLDWCQQAVGVAPKKDNNMFFTRWDSTAVMSHHHVFNDFFDKAAKQLADEIDKEILGTYEHKWEHTVKYAKLGEELYDHGKFSELMLFPTVESEIEDQED